MMSSPQLALANSNHSAELKQDFDRVFELAAETFRVMSSSTRLRIINQLCAGEKNVGQLLELVQTTQPNMSQHLNTLYKAGIVGRRREGVQMYYRIVSPQVVALCRAMCGTVAAQANLAHP
jgi:DNA-binding transcriptional ArsR family regulator